MSCMTLLVHYLFIFALFKQSKEDTIVEKDRLIADLTNGYNKEIRPPENNTEILHVNCSFFLMSINNYDDISGVLSVTGGVIMTWFDSRLSWNPAKYSGIDNIVLRRSRIWTPDVYVVNPADNFGSIGDDGYLARFFSNGLTMVGMGKNIKILCPGDMTYFPFDVQSCSVRITAWTYLSSEIVLIPSINRIDMTYYTPNNMWDIASTYAEGFSLSEEFSGMASFTVKLRRKPLYFAISMMAPIFLLSLLNPFIFLLPVESGERISFGVTIFLSFAVFLTLLSDNLPKSSTPLPIICYFLFAVNVYSGLITIVTMLLMRLHYGDPNLKAPKWLIRLVYCLSDRCLSRNGCKEKPSEVSKKSKQDESSLSLNEKQTRRESCVELAQKLDQILFIYFVSINCLMVLCMILMMSRAP